MTILIYYFHHHTEYDDDAQYDETKIVLLSWSQVGSWVIIRSSDDSDATSIPLPKKPWAAAIKTYGSPEPENDDEGDSDGDSDCDSEPDSEFPELSIDDLRWLANQGEEEPDGAEYNPGLYWEGDGVESLEQSDPEEDVEEDDSYGEDEIDTSAKATSMVSFCERIWFRLIRRDSSLRDVLFLEKKRVKVETDDLSITFTCAELCLQGVPTVWVGQVLQEATARSSTQFSNPELLPAVKNLKCQWFLLKEVKAAKGKQKQGQLYGNLVMAESPGSRPTARKYLTGTVTVPSLEILAVFEKDAYLPMHAKKTKGSPAETKFSSAHVEAALKFAAVTDRYKEFLVQQDRDRRLNT